jgi:hypothetical protein
MSHGTLMEEDFPARIEAVFPDRKSATTAANALCQRFEFDEAQLSIVPPEEASSGVHRNRFAYKASGRRQQRRQLAATLIAFALIGIGLILLQVFGATTPPSGLTAAIMGGLIVAAVVITVISLLSWRPARVQTQYRLQPGETALVILVHDVTEQYPLREVLLEMGARIHGPASDSIS